MSRSSLDFESSASANSATSAYFSSCHFYILTQEQKKSKKIFVHPGVFLKTPGCIFYLFRVRIIDQN